MTQETPGDETGLCNDGRQSPAAAEIARGVVRLMTGLGFACVPELALASGLRADVTALSHDGRIWIIEIKSCLQDFRTDQKWQGYLDYCDGFCFAVNQDFPVSVLPQEQGVIIADRFGATVVREIATKPPLVAARRKAMTLRIARTAAARLSAALDPALRLAFAGIQD